MTTKRLRCLDCDGVLPMAYIYSCPDCHGALDVVYEFDGDLEAPSLKRSMAQVKPGLMHYSGLLPLDHPEAMITLGEGGTQLLPLENLRTSAGLPSLYLKNEASNPTASFKDRPLSVSASRAREAGLATLVIASSGNAGAAAAAYAARGGLRCIVLVPEKTPTAKVSQSLAYGARVVRVIGSFSDCYQLAMHASRIQLCANVTTTYLNPFNLEGDKTVAYELLAQLGSQVPDAVVVPIGAGPLLAGIHKGFRELQSLGLCSKVPAMVGVQAEGCAPIVRAFDAGRPQADPWGDVKTVASAIADPLRGYERDAAYTLNAIRESGGRAVAVSDDDILEACSELARLEGMFLEPSAASTLAATRRLVEAGWFHKEQKVVLVATGHGLKDPGVSLPRSGVIPVIDPSIQKLEEFIR